MAKLVKQQLELKKKVFSKKQLSKQSLQFGLMAENLASAFLTAKNHQILERNLRFKNHELDLITLDHQHNEYVFVEVKWRKNRNRGGGEQAVNWQKIKSMQIVASAWLEKQSPKAYRFDIISLTGNLKKGLKSQGLNIAHFENVTWL